MLGKKLALLLYKKGCANADTSPFRLYKSICLVFLFLVIVEEPSLTTESLAAILT